MAKYTYKARDSQGKLVRGSFEGDSRDAAVKALKSRGLIITQLQEAPESSFSKLSKSVSRKPVKAKVLAILARQFAIQLEAGVSLINSLQLLEEQSQDKRLTDALRTIRLDIASGSSFTDAINKHRTVFPHEFVHLVEAGELAGELSTVFNQLAVYYEKEDELQKKVSEALMYPAIIGSVAFLVVLALLFVVLPMLIQNFSSFGVQIPAITLAVLDARDFAVKYWYAILALIIGFGFAYRWYFSTSVGKWQKDLIMLKVPVLGNLNKMIVFARFCRIFGLLLDSGISIIKSLDICERLVENVVIKRSLAKSRTAVESGRSLVEPMKENPIFPMMLVQMIAVGESTGNLENSLGHLADFYDKEVNFAVGSFTKLIEPITILILAVIVLFILVSVYLPMIQMMTQI